MIFIIIVLLIKCAREIFYVRQPGCLNILKKSVLLYIKYTIIISFYKKKIFYKENFTFRTLFFSF